MKSSKYINYVIIALIFLCLLAISWHKWGNPIVDTFRDPWIAYKITQGNVLYKDFYYFYGPLPLYFISFLFKIFSVNINCLVLTGILITIISSIFVYRISRFFTNRAFSTLIVLTFLFVFAFGCYCYNGIFNFILPYNIASTFFITLVLSALYFFIKFVMKENNKYLFWWGCSTYFVFLSRLDMSLAVWIIFAFIYFIYLHKKMKLIAIIYVFLPFLLVLLSYWIFLYLNNGFNGFKESVIDAFSFKERSKWELNISGFDNFSINLITIAKCFIFQLAAVLFLYTGSAISSFIVKRSRAQISDKLMFLVCGLLSIIMVSYLLKFMHYFNQYRLTPLLLISGIVICSFKLFFTGNVNRKKYLSLLTLFSISLVLILRRVLNVSPNHYGFYLLIPGLICYYVFFVEIYPSFFKKFFNIESKGRNYYHFSLFIFFVLLLFPFVKQNYIIYKNKRFTIISDRGRMCFFNDNLTRRFLEAIIYLNKNTPKNSTVVVFPEGIGINFFSYRNNPLKYINFIPTQLGKIGDNNIIKELTIHKIDYVVVVNRSTSEHGYPFFGIHYGEKLYCWILDNYKPVKLIGPYPFTSHEFGVAIFKKK